MIELYYTAIDIAVILLALNLKSDEETELLNVIWESETSFISAEYRKDQKKFLLDVKYWMHYFYGKESFDAEYPVIQKDFVATGHEIDVSKFTDDFSNLDLYFKNLRIRILYYGTQPYVRIKLRTLLRIYGYKRRSPQILNYINNCLYFYHIKSYLRNGLECNITEVSLDDMIIFRVC